MGRIERTVFISYRRTNFPWALAIFQNLTQHGYDVFFDYTGIASGDFEGVILQNIHARAHFLVLLTPSALERCSEPADWLRREIEAALDSQRNIVPVMVEGFWFGAPDIARQLSGKLAALKHYNALSIPPEYFFEAMERLREQYLSVALDAVLHPASRIAQQAAKEQKGAAVLAPAVEEETLAAAVAEEAPSSQQPPTLEIAHVLFIDTVAYSRLPMDEQRQVIGELGRAVRDTATVARAQAEDKLIRLPTGDGMALVFFGDPESPVKCALELRRNLRHHPEIKLRMGIHSGPVYRVEAINAARNVAGGGINMAQRVMDCGDAGHILVSQALVDALVHVQGSILSKVVLCDLGEAEVKHGVRVHIYNLYTDDEGNAETPRALAARARTSKGSRLENLFRKLIY